MELINEDKLNTELFKTIYSDLIWQRLPRQLGPNHQQYFYVGEYDDGIKTIRVQIRPSMWMKVTESYKKYDKNGKEIDNKYTGQIYSFGKTVEVLIDDNVLDKIKKLAIPQNKNDIQRISWS